jgi:hypothetical protein
MVFHPAILSLYLSSILICFMVLYASSFGVQILRRWDIKSGSETQLLLERKTYLISTLLTYAFGFQLLSLFLYIFTVDHLHTLFVGAMCAAGSLFVNSYGYPALGLKVINCLLAGLWLTLNYTDNRGYDYPLLRKKYGFLLLLAPLILAEMVFQSGYFISLKPDIITSCCGSLFSTEQSGLGSELAVLPITPMKIAFYLSIILTIASGVYYYGKERGAYFFSLLSGITFLVAVASIISFISVYFYELPTHHCPFCILQREYGYIGYPLYISLLGGTIMGVGVGMLNPFKKMKSLSEIVPSIQKRLAIASVILFLLFTVIVTYRIVFTDFVLEA